MPGLPPYLSASYLCITSLHIFDIFDIAPDIAPNIPTAVVLSDDLSSL